MSFSDRLQGFVNSLSEGAGVALLRAFIFLVLLSALFWTYGRSQFRGLKDPEAMEAAQLARNLAEGRGFSTDCVRPVDLWVLEQTGRKHLPRIRIPDIRHAPLFPVVLSWGLKLIRPEYETAPKQFLFGPEKAVMVPLGIIFSVLTAGLMYLIGRRLFNVRVGVAAALVYVVSDTVLADSISGTALPLATLLITAAVHASLAAVQNKRDERHPAAWAMPFLLSGVLGGLAILAGYKMLVVLPVLGVFVAVSAGRGRGSLAAVVVVVAIMVFAPWLARNRVVSGRLFGAAPYAAFQDTRLHPGDTFNRSVVPETARPKIRPSLKLKIAQNLHRFYDMDLRTLGNGLVVCFFLVAFVLHFDDDIANVLRWSVGLGLILMMLMACVEGRPGALRVFLPFVVVFGVGCAFDLFSDKVEWPEEFWQPYLVGLLVVLTSVPLLLKLFALPAPPAYPPYFPPFVQYVCGLLEPDEAICTDIPWATAWYGRRRSVLLPRTVEEFLAMHDEKMPVAALYITTETGNRAYTRDLATGSESSWFPILNRQVPAGFPFTNGIALPPGSRDQIFLTDRMRW